MSRLILAILPSNQSGNTSDALAPRNEQQHIRPLAGAILMQAAQHQSIVACCFYGSPESADSPRGSLSGLIDQQKRAAAWIRATRQEGDLTVSLNLHSDSGDRSHCGYFYDSISGPVSAWLGKALADAIKRWFGGVVIHADYGAAGYIFARETRAVACPILVECGAHTILADVAAVRDHAGEIAADLVGAMVGFFGLETSPPLDIAELRVYPAWAMARLDNGEDSRIMADFRQHLRALGCADDPYRYGSPI